MKNIIWITSFTLLLCLWSNSKAIAQTRQADSLALVTFYDSCCNTGCILNWDFTQSMDSWDGVTLTGGRVTILNLHGRNLTGTLADWNLSALAEVRLDLNQLSGSVPDFTNLPNLVRLSLGRNQLSGNVPDFTNLPNLVRLSLEGNQLSGSIPDFTNLPALKELYLGYNQLSGSIPNFTNLPTLNYLHLFDNQLSGKVPAFTNLTYLYLGRNKFTFGDLLPLYFSSNTSITTSYYFSIDNQDKIGVPTTIATPTIGASYTIDLMVDDGVRTNVYYWYKDGVAIDTTFGVNEYTINNFQALDAGVYTAQVKNTIVTDPRSGFRNLILDSHPFFLGVSTSIVDREVPQLEVFPNPTQDVFYVQTQTKGLDYSVQVMNLQGQVLENVSGNGNSLFVFSMAEYPSGMYIVHLQQGKQIWQEKVIKQ